MRELPKELVDEIRALADKFELTIRADERDRLISKMRGTLFAEQLGDALADDTPPLPESVPQPNGNVDLTTTHYCAIRWMSQGFIAVPTLAGHMGVKKQSVYAYLSDIKKAGYDLEIKSTGNRRGGYRNIYRLARPA
tara:strand:+ start:1507 stop:1917 length:411 start_codon:yes stop_codon:yes gene_type:complete